MFVLNKIVDGLLNPLAIGVLALAAAFVLFARGRRRWGWGVFAGGCAWLWFWSMPVVGDWLCMTLERDWPPQRVEEVPQGDVIVLLGGGMSSCTNVAPYANMCGAADRVWHAARLYKAGKAPKVVPTGVSASTCELPLLLDFGVPRDAIMLEEQARNTEENAKFVEKMVLGEKRPERKPRMLLVTSATHMRRAKMMYERYAPGLEIVPVPCDHEGFIHHGQPLTAGHFFPSVYSLAGTSFAFKEYIGYWGYKLLRR